MSARPTQPIDSAMSCAEIEAGLKSHDRAEIDVPFALARDSGYAKQPRSRAIDPAYATPGPDEVRQFEW